MKPREQSSRSWLRTLRGKSVQELEALLVNIELQENETLKPLARQKAALQKVLKEKRLTLISQISQTPTNIYDSEGIGLPITPVIHASENPIGDINLLMDKVPLTTAPFDRIIINICRNLIATTGGLMPTMEVKPMKSDDEKGYRLVVKWTVPRAISTEELFRVEQLAQAVYERHVSGHKKQGNGWEKVVKYIDLQNKAIPERQGIYFGPEGYFDAEATGVIIYRQFTSSAEAKYLGQAHPEDWITRSVEKIVTHTEIEFREGATDKDKPGLSQERFLQFAVQLSYLLAKGRLIENRILMTAIFRELNKVGTNPIEREKLYGMKTTLQIIERVLIFPLQRPDLARSYHFRPESLLLVGIPGIGKTFLAHYLMTGNYNAIFASVDSDRMRQDLVKSGDSGMSSIFLKIDIIKDATSLPVILLIDDIDVILDEEHDKGVVSKFLNLMQGIRQRGFHILATTNYPEKIDKRLFEPGRLSKIVHVQLPDEQDRAGVIANHLVELPFQNEEEKQIIIKEMVEKTEGWSQRYLWELCVEAGRLRGLQLSQSVPQVVTREVPPLAKKDFEQAYAELVKNINLKELREWNERIAAFVSHSQARQVGF